MSNDDTSDDDEYAFFDRLEQFPSSDKVLAAVRKHRTVRQFQIFAEKGLSALTCDEIGTVDRKDAWRSVLHTFACLYIEELENNVREVSIFFLNYYTNLRGKDYVRKFNARSNISTETLRATVGVTYELARKRNENDRKRLSQNIAAPPNESMDNAEDDDGEDLENVYDFETMLKKQLKALCKLYDLPVSGNKPVLLNRLREFTASHQNESELELRDNLNNI